MHIRDWDLEVAGLERDLRQFVAYSAAQNAPVKSQSLAARRLEELQLQAFLGHALRKLETVESSPEFSQETKRFLSQEQVSLVYWLGRYGQKLRELNQRQSKIFSRQLWINLIKARLGNGQGSPLEVNDEEIIGMAIRQGNLSKTEKFLTNYLSELHNRKSDLLQRFKEVEIAKANVAAGASIQGRLGADVRAALRSPTMRAINMFFLRVTAPARNEKMRDEMAEYQKDLWNRSTRVMSACRDMIAGTFAGNGHRAKHRTSRKQMSDKAFARVGKERLLRSLEDLYQLDNRARAALSFSGAESAKTLSPRIVKGASRSAK